MRRKLQRFRAIQEFTNVLEPTKCIFTNLKGNWHQFFANSNSINLEIGCGKGEYTISLAEQFPEQNFIGIDVKGDRIYIGAKQALTKNLKNVLFLRIQAEQIVDFFEQEEVKEIWLTFPDPQPKKVKKRLTSLEFLSKYRLILAKENKIHLKTDSQELFDFTLDLLKNLQQRELKNKQESLNLVIDNLLFTEDLDNSNLQDRAFVKIQTTYEKKFRNQNKTIKYLEFTIST